MGLLAGEAIDGLDQEHGPGLDPMGLKHLKGTLNNQPAQASAKTRAQSAQWHPCLPDASLDECSRCPQATARDSITKVVRGGRAIPSRALKWSIAAGRISILFWRAWL